jgi:hypothetical protein
LKPVLKLKKISAPLPEAKVAVRAKTRTLTQLMGIANYKGPTITLQQMKGMRRAKVAD